MVKMTKLDKKFMNKQKLELHVKTLMEILYVSNRSTTWNDFIRTKAWLYIYENTTESMRDLFKKKWIEMEVDFRGE